MVLSDMNELWGIPIVYLKEYSKKYKFYAGVVYLIDALVIIGMTSFMYVNNISYNAYGFLIVVSAIFVYMGLSKFLNMDNWLVFKFYKKNIRGSIREVHYNLDADVLYSILYCVGYKRLKSNRSIQEYQELIRGACCENCKYSSKLMDYLKKYEDSSGTVTCYILTRKNCEYFIDFK